MTVRRELLLRLASAIWGFAIAVSLLPIWLRPASPDQLPGYLASIGIDEHAPFRFIAGLIVIPILVVLALRPAMAILARDDTRAWARNAFCAATVAVLWLVIITRDLAWVVIAPALMLIVCIALRRLDARFSRHDLILIPAYATFYFALIDLLPEPVDKATLIALAVIFAIRIGIVTLRQGRALPPALCFALAPLGLLLQSHFNSYDVRHSPWGPFAFAIVTPVLLRLFVRDSPATRRRFRIAIAFVVYPIAAYAYLSAASLFAAEGMPRADLFEDTHHLVPASEMLRGETLYRDIIPAHGLAQDALLDWVALRTGPVTLGRAMKFRGVVSGLNIVAQYALVTAATASPDVGIAAIFLGALLGTAGGPFRTLPAMATLAILVYALRKRDPRWLAVGGAGAVLAVMTSIDFGAYAILMVIVAVVRFRDADDAPTRTALGALRSRMRPLKFAAIGVASMTLVVFIVLAAKGIAIDFVRVTLFEIAPLGPVYALTPFDAPPALSAMHNIPEVLATLFDKGAYLFVFWVINLLLTAAAIASPAPNMSGRRRARREAALLISVFAIITSLSYAERHHLYWQFVAGPLIAVAIFRLFHSRMPLARSLAPAAVIIALMLAQPTSHIAIASSLRRSRGPLDPAWRELGLPRARGALCKATDAVTIDVVHRYVDSHLRADETWFDFTNRGNLYFLLDRDCPIRQLEVAFYETEERQREVIERIEKNPHIRFALMPPDPIDNTAVDGVANRVRAPLVYKYLQQHFQPDHEEGGVIFWRRDR